jgi:hypothetical protein
LGSSIVRFASLEDVVIHKVIVPRARDFDHIKSILLKNPKFDSVYIKKWLKEFDKSLGEKVLKDIQKHREVNSMTNIVGKLWGFYHTLRYDGST